MEVKQNDPMTEAQIYRVAHQALSRYPALCQGSCH